MSHVEKHKEKIDSYSISRSFSRAVSNVTISETIHGQCKNILTEGYLSVDINFRPTRPLPISGRELIQSKDYPTHFNPLMDLHDYSSISYTWTFKGERQTEIEYLDLSNLKYIQKDNEEISTPIKLASKY